MTTDFPYFCTIGCGSKFELRIIIKDILPRLKSVVRLYGKVHGTLINIYDDSDVISSFLSAVLAAMM